jgi:hypothetical protein
MAHQVERERERMCVCVCTYGYTHTQHTHTHIIYQGSFPVCTFADLGGGGGSKGGEGWGGGRWRREMLRAYMDGGTGGGVEGEEGGGGGRLVALRGAILLADKVVTVSPSYAREILSAHGAFGLQLQVSC